MIPLDVQAFGASSSSTLSPFQSRQRKVSAYVTSLTPPPPITVNEARSRKASAMPGLMPTKSALKSKRFELILSVLTNMGSYSIFKETLFKSYIYLIKSYDIIPSVFLHFDSTNARKSKFYTRDFIILSYYIPHLLLWGNIF